MEGRTRGGLDARAATRPDHLTFAGEPMRASKWLLLRITILGTRTKLFRRWRTCRNSGTHRSGGQRQSIRLRHLPRALQTFVARRCKGRSFRKVYC